LRPSRIPKGCEEISRWWSAAKPPGHAEKKNRTPKVCEENRSPRTSGARNHFLNVEPVVSLRSTTG
jgi:hypothetical protein